MGCEPLTEAKMEAEFKMYVKELGMEEEVSLVFSQEMISAAQMTHDPIYGTSALNIRLPTN